MIFEWDQEKAASNELKHGVSFEIDDPDHSDDEDRYVLLGLTHAGRLVLVVHTERGDVIRVISARLAASHERRDYEQA